jgi:hypothetical protein
MTAAEFDSLFDLICDKVGSDYFSDPEKESFINLAQYSVIDGLLFPQRRNQEKKDNDVFEFSYQNSMVQGLSQLHLVISPIAASTSQTLLFSDISADILTIYGVVAQPYKIINFTLPTDAANQIPQWNAKFVGTQQGSNSIYKNLRFGKNTDVRYATYNIRKSSTSEEKEIYWTAPLLLVAGVGVELIRTPVPFDISSSQTCEVDAIYHPEILFRALQLAGIAIRESEFYEMTNIEQTKEA